MNRLQKSRLTLAIYMTAALLMVGAIVQINRNKHDEWLKQEHHRYQTPVEIWEVYAGFVTSEHIIFVVNNDTGWATFSFNRTVDNHLSYKTGTADFWFMLEELQEIIVLNDGQKIETDEYYYVFYI